MQFANVDGKTLTDKAQGALDELSSEIGGILKKEEGKNGEVPNSGRPLEGVDIDAKRRDMPRGVGE